MPNLNKIFDIIGGSEKSEYSEFTPQLIVNMFFTQNAEAIQKKALFPMEGLSLDNGIIFNVGGENKGGRASYYFNGAMFQIIKDTVFRVTGNYDEEGLPKFNHSILGTLNTQTGHVDIDDNNQQVMFVDGVDGYLYDSATDSFGLVTSPNFPSSPSTVAVLANRFVVNKGGTSQSFYSAQGDGNSWGANDFFSMASKPDIVVAYATLNGRLYIMGQRSTEVWYAVGSPTLPFRPQNPSYEFGCDAIGSVAVGFGMIIWLSRTNYGIGGIKKIQGQNLPVDVSNEGLDTSLDSYTNPEDATAFLFKNDVGHIMYVINFTTDNESWMLDFNTGKLSKLESGEFNRYSGNTYINYKNHHYVLDYQNPYMYDMSTNYNDEAGNAIRRAVISPVFLSPNPQTINDFQVFLKHGTGTESGNDENPTLSLSVSNDGGVSYSTVIKRPIGPIGERCTKTVWNNLGWADSWVFKLEHYNKTKCVILGAMGNVGES